MPGPPLDAGIPSQVADIFSTTSASYHGDRYDVLLIREETQWHLPYPVVGTR